MGEVTYEIGNGLGFLIFLLAIILIGVWAYSWYGGVELDNREKRLALDEQQLRNELLRQQLRNGTATECLT